MSINELKLHLSAGPHIRCERTTQQVMWMVNLALAPALVWAAIVFGWQPIGITLSALLGCLIAEHLSCVASKTASTLPDGSAVCSGLLLAYTLPPGIDIWMPFVGGALAVFFTKSVFGGLGYNIFNVALVGRAIMMASFPVEMTTTWTPPQFGSAAAVDAVTAATPLATLKAEGVDGALSLFNNALVNSDYWLTFFLGLRSGSIGEISVLFILLGAGYLLWKRIIKLYIPLSVIAGVALMSLLTDAPMIYMLSGGVWLGAFFMATDYVTSPSTPKGQILFGLGIGLLTGIIRNWGGYPEGICYAILLMNTLAPALDEWFPPKRVSAAGAPS